MPLIDMQNELRGAVPKLPYTYAKTLIQRAYRTIRERSLWSFLLFDGQWIAPPQFNGVSASVQQGVATATLSTADSALLASTLFTQPYSVLTSRQFRVGAGGLYNIRNYAAGPPAVLTLDRQYGEATNSAVAFQIYQAYYIPNSGSTPITDFKSWVSVRDMANFRTLFTDRLTRRDLDMRDPQRTWYGIPTDVVPFDVDSSTGALMFELWGAPTFNITYQLYGLRGGSDLVKPTDTLPYAIGEDCVLALARFYAYQWAEANKDITPRNVGPDFKFLMGATLKEYETLLGVYRRGDRERVDNWFSSFRLGGPEIYAAHYNTLGSVAGPGGMP